MRQATRLAGLAIVVTAIILGAAELSARLIAGERLLYRADPAIEYLPKPNQSVVQRGVRFETNERGMRSPAIAERGEDVFRVLVLGDSVVFGHTNINQADLATSLLSRLEMGDGRRIEALNVSAPSWGPGNLLAWIEANALLSADAAVIVLSSHDLDDNRTFGPPDWRTYPQEQPLFVLGDWIARIVSGNAGGRAATSASSTNDARGSLPMLFQQVATAPSGGCLVLHSTVDELFSLTPSAAIDEIRQAATASGLDIVHARDLIDSSDYIDNIHLSEEGQANLAKAMMACPAISGGPRRG